MSLLWKLRFCLRFTLQTRGILKTESLDIPNDPYVMYANPQGEITTALNIACHKSLFNKNYPLHIIIWINGWTNIILPNDQIDFVFSEPTMIFSADVFHSGRGDNRPSIAAVCASLDSKATKYGRFSVNKDP
ncbi:Piwi domain-containing protein [Rhizophagus irregularis DAOM 181602=DAOM 197198]|nr:Piwi domain-containing protein [Rhizophagus irregularis DAOM 181602=DAOM 197198]